MPAVHHRHIAVTRQLSHQPASCLLGLFESRDGTLAVAHPRRGINDQGCRHRSFLVPQHGAPLTIKRSSDQHDITGRQQQGCQRQQANQDRPTGSQPAGDTASHDDHKQQADQADQYPAAPVVGIHTGPRQGRGQQQDQQHSQQQQQPVS